MSSLRVTIAASLVLTFLFGVFCGFMVADALSWRVSSKAKCDSVGGNYGGGRCYLNGVESLNTTNNQ